MQSSPRADLSAGVSTDVLAILSSPPAAFRKSLSKKDDRVNVHVKSRASLCTTLIALGKAEKCPNYSAPASHRPPQVHMQTQAHTPDKEISVFQK